MHHLKLLATAAVAFTATAACADDLKIALIYGKTGALEAYAKQTETGLRMGRSSSDSPGTSFKIAWPRPSRGRVPAATASSIRIQARSGAARRVWRNRLPGSCTSSPVAAPPERSVAEDPWP